MLGYLFYAIDLHLFLKNWSNPSKFHYVLKKETFPNVIDEKIMG